MNTKKNRRDPSFLSFVEAALQAVFTPLRCFLLGLLVCPLQSGCGATSSPSFQVYPGTPISPPILIPNPLLIPVANHEYVFDQVVDVVDDYFRIQSEQRVQSANELLTEGRIDTYPQGGATWFEPHRWDSAGSYNRWESTLQSIRRQAQVRITPHEGGFLIEVIVEKELENLSKPERALAGAATFPNENGLGNSRRPLPTGNQNVHWIPQGRDIALEQQILAGIQARFAGSAVGMAYWGSPPWP